MSLTSPAPSLFPFDKLPKELKTEVLILDALVVKDDEGYRQEMRTRALKLATVCKEWREIVQDLPQLWSSIYINCYYYRHNKEVFDMYIHYSKSHPLDISVTYGGRSDWQLNQATQVSYGLLQESHRLKSLFISFGDLWHDIDVDWSRIYRNTKQLLVDFDMPLLEKVELRQDGAINPIRDYWGLDMDNMLSNSPRLDELSIALLDHDSLDALACCTTLTSLELAAVSVEFCIDAITNLPNLIHAGFKNIYHPEDRGRLPQNFEFTSKDGNDTTVFVRKSLRSLTLFVQDENVSELFLRSISCPSLDRLYVRNRQSPNEEHILQAIIKFLRVSNCPLGTLVLQMDRLDSSSIWSLFDCIHTTVISLRLWPKSAKSNLIPLLAEKLSSPSYFPQLKQINIFPLCGPFDYTFIFKKLQKRADLWPSGTNIGPEIIDVALDYMTPPKGDSEEDKAPASGKGVQGICLSTWGRFTNLSPRGIPSHSPVGELYYIW